ncbi:MAG TPA: hypothetical protein VFQ53_12890 [Kofleriaceae bacterium]|nr:hypothetical protein [Kofleriaceae bacterium]
MAKSPSSKRDEQYELSRRALIKWTVAAGAALGVSRSKVFDILEKSAGKGVAFAASSNPTMRSVHLVAGNGGLAWFTLLWPHYDIALSGNANFAYHKPGQATLVQGTNKPLAIGPDTPFASLPAARQMTCFTCGRNETHTSTPVSTTTLNGSNIHAVASVLQAQTPTVLPIIQVGDADVGVAPGASQPTQVGDGDSIVGLFNSAASRAGGLLAQQSDASLYKAQYDAFAQLNRAAGLSTQKGSYLTASGAAQFLGTNLAAKLAITPEDLALYGIDGGTRGNVASIGRTLIIAVKAFAMGLTNAVVLPAMRDDPHGAFQDGSNQTVPPQLKKVFDGFMMHLTNTIDSATQKSLVDDVVMTISGDTPKDSRDRNGWPDGTSGNTNIVYVLGGGHLKTGWFGSVDRGGTVKGFDSNGNDAGYNQTSTAQLATASIAYAIAKRDMRAIAQFANGVSLTGLTNPLDQ